MRTIKKGAEPRSLREWRAGNMGKVNFHYDHLPKEVRKDLKLALIKEQGGLCAYTGLRIWHKTASGESNAHIEHLKPRSRSNREDKPEETTDYGNLVACYPGDRQPHPGFGAAQKADWPKDAQEAALFVSPLSEGCEGRFRYKINGEMLPSSPQDKAAVATIEKLKLDDPKGALRNLRGQCLARVLKLRSKEAQQWIHNLDGETGSRAEFCFALRQALEGQIKRLGHIRKSASS
jgi:uncharacterized protein (TIGR02646 family)